MITGHLRCADRGVLSLSGPDSRGFLQGLISNDVNRLSPHHSLFAALLTPQGKYLFDFVLYDDGLRILLDAQRSGLDDLKRRLMMYRLRSKCEIEDLSESYEVHLACGDDLPERFGLGATRGNAKPFEGGVIAVDPRLAELGLRAVLPKRSSAFAALDSLDAVEFMRHRMVLGVAEGEPELVPQKSLLLESNFEELAGVDFKKGCFVGQELTARTKYRGLVRKRILPIRLDGPAPEGGTPILDGQREVGEIRAVAGDRGLALMRLDRLALDAPLPALQAARSEVRVDMPPWLNL